MTDPYVGSLIGFYSITIVLAAVWLIIPLILRFVRRYHIPSDSWLAGILIVVSFYLALVMAIVWPVFLLYGLWKKRESG